MGFFSHVLHQHLQNLITYIWFLQYVQCYSQCPHIRHFSPRPAPVGAWGELPNLFFVYISWFLVSACFFLLLLMPHLGGWTITQCTHSPDSSSCLALASDNSFRNYSHWALLRSCWMLMLLPFRGSQWINSWWCNPYTWQVEACCFFCCSFSKPNKLGNCFQWITFSITVLIRSCTWASSALSLVSPRLMLTVSRFSGRWWIMRVFSSALLLHNFLGQLS